MAKRKQEVRHQRAEARRRLSLTSDFLLLASIFIFLFFSTAFASFTPEQQTQLTQLQNQVIQNPTDAQTGKKLAQVYALYVEAQEKLAGVDYFINFLAENPTHPYFSTARRLLGNLYQNQKNYIAARDEYQRVITEFPNSEDARRALYCIAIGYTEAKQYTDAIPVFTSYIEAYPTDKLVPNCYFHIAESYAELGNLEQAAETISNIQIKDVKKAGAFQTSGWAEQALKYLDQYLAKATSPEDKASTYLQKGIYVQLLGDTTTARNSFAQAYQLEPTSDIGKKALYYQGLSYLGDRTYTGCSTALTLFEQIRNQFANDSVAVSSQLYQAVVRYRMKDRDKALSAFVEFINQYPNHELTPKAAYLAAIINKDTKRNYPNALTYFNKTIDLITTRNQLGKDPAVSYWQEEALTPDSLLYRSWEFKMHVFLNLYGFDSAKELGNQMQTLYPTDHGIHQLGKQVPLIILQWRGNWNELITQSDSFIAQCPASAKKWVSIPGCALYLKAFALQKLNRDTEAIAVYNQAVQEYPESRFTDTGLMFMGKCYEHLGDYYSAVSTYDRYLALFSGRALTYEAYLLKANAFTKLNHYTEAITTLDTFLANYTARYDRPDGTILQAKELKVKYQAQISPVQLTAEQMGQLKGGCPCYPCGITGCGCIVCGQTPKCSSYCKAPDCDCNGGDNCDISYGPCGCGTNCGCEWNCYHHDFPPETHVFNCGWSGNNPTDKTCGCAGAFECPCCSGPKCGSCAGAKACDCGDENCDCPNYCKEYEHCPTCNDILQSCLCMMNPDTGQPEACGTCPGTLCWSVNPEECSTCAGSACCCRVTSEDNTLCNSAVCSGSGEPCKNYEPCEQGKCCRTNSSAPYDAGSGAGVCNDSDQCYLVTKNICEGTHHCTITYDIKAQHIHDSWWHSIAACLLLSEDDRCRENTACVWSYGIFQGVPEGTGGCSPYPGNGSEHVECPPIPPSCYVYYTECHCSQ
jgi:TolA-binding protein